MPFNRFIATLTLSASLIIAACDNSESIQAETEPPVPGDLGQTVDHHMHLSTDIDREALAAINAVLPPEMQGEEVDWSAPPIGAEEIIGELNGAGLDRGVIVSSGYLAVMPENPARLEDKEDMLRRINDSTMAEARRYPERLLGFCAVNPILVSAEAEIERCVETWNTDGLKLHFTNSDVDLRDAAHLARLRSVLETAARRNLPVMTHMRTRATDFGAEDVRNFATRVLIHTPNLDIHISHLSGWGGFDANTLEALEAWAYLFETTELAANDGIGFNTSATVTRHPNEFYAPVAELMHRIGIQRFFIGSDWPSHNSPRWVGLNVHNQLPLSETDMEALLSNAANWIAD